MFIDKLSEMYIIRFYKRQNICYIVSNDKGLESGIAQI